MKKVALFFIFIIPSFAQAADLKAGEALFAQRCASCHGPQGAGDGPVAAALPPELKPRNLATGPFKVALDAAKLKELLNKGGAAMGLNPLMPPQPGMTDVEMDNLVAFTMSLRKS